MPISTARFATAHAEKYLQQLCKHWSHRFSVEVMPGKGRIAFSGDEALDLAADADGLTLVLRSTGDPAAHADLEQVVAEHLQRFAFREVFALDWSGIDPDET